MSKLGQSKSNLKGNDMSLLKDEYHISGHHPTSCAMNNDKLPVKTSTYLSSMNNDKDEASSSSTIHNDKEMDILLKESDVIFERNNLQDKKQKTELANINIILGECRIQDVVECDKKKNTNSKDIFKITNNDKDRIVFPTRQRNVGTNNVIRQKYRTFGTNEPGLKMKPAIHKCDLNSEPRLETKAQESEINIMKITNKNKAVKFNPEVQVIYAIKKAGNSEIVLNTIEILNKEKDQQARNHQMRKSYSLIKLNTFLF